MKAVTAAFATLVLLFAVCALLQPSFAQPASTLTPAQTGAAKTSKVDSIAVKQKVTTDDIGDARDYGNEPGKMETPAQKNNQPPQIEINAGRFPFKGVQETVTTTSTTTTAGPPPPPPVEQSPLRNAPAPKQNTVLRPPGH